jgi:hypothetical protein
MATPLRPCPGCLRHVRATEPACPFCRQGLDGAFRSVPSPRAPTRRLTRAALFALGATGLAASACGGQVSGPALHGDASDDDATSIANGDATSAADANVSSAPGDGGLDESSTVIAATDAAYTPCCSRDAGLYSCCNEPPPYGLPPGL